MVEPCSAIPFSNTILTTYLVCLGVGGLFRESFDCRGECLNTSVKRAAVKALDRRIKGSEMGGKFMCLFNAFACECGVRSYAGGGGN
jgi:hypothetical protein